MVWMGIFLSNSRLCTHQPLYLPDLTPCSVNGIEGQCASGRCTSRNLQCYEFSNSEECPTQLNSCLAYCSRDKLNCFFSNHAFRDGTPCSYGGFCYKGTCNVSSFRLAIGFIIQNKSYIILGAAILILCIFILWKRISKSKLKALSLERENYLQEKSKVEELTVRKESDGSDKGSPKRPSNLVVKVPENNKKVETGQSTAYLHSGELDTARDRRQFTWDQKANKEELTPLSGTSNRVKNFQKFKGRDKKTESDKVE
jgi:hypothetical protein